MTAVWATIAALALATAAIRGAGPVLLGGRALPPPVMAVVGLLAPALLAALVVTQTLGHAQGLAIDERLAGVGAAGLAIAAGRSVIFAVLVAATLTASLRAVG